MKRGFTLPELLMALFWFPFFERTPFLCNKYFCWYITKAFPTPNSHQNPKAIFASFAYFVSLNRKNWTFFSQKTGPAFYNSFDFLRPVALTTHD